MTTIAKPSNGYPGSDLFEVRETEYSGRGVFALQDIPRGTQLLEANTPVAWVIYDEYAKEVCAQCFVYDRGKAWKVRDNVKGVVFCSAECQARWTQELRGDQAVTRDELQKLIRRRRKIKIDDLEKNRHQPSLEEVDRHWAEVELVAEGIRACRASAMPTKRQRKILQETQDRFLNSQETYHLWYMFEGLVNRISEPKGWDAVKQLAADDAPYKETGDMMRKTEAYLLMLTVVLETLLPLVTQTAVRALQAHSSHNVFGLRSLDEGGEAGDAGSECFGYGLWPQASYWNHSCAPNIQKRRSGRAWRFWATRDISKGEELCISYLGGDERSLVTSERRAQLKETWGFDCGCSICRLDDLDVIKEKLRDVPVLGTDVALAS